jgi:hypothetical protein
MECRFGWTEEESSRLPRFSSELQVRRFCFAHWKVLRDVSEVRVPFSVSISAELLCNSVQSLETQVDINNSHTRWLESDRGSGGP